MVFSQSMPHSAPRIRCLLALAVLLLPLVLVGGTVQHTHDGAGIGLYNHEHDLVLMAALGSVAPLPVVVTAVAVVVGTLLTAAPAVVVDSSTRRLEVSRAPPTA